MDLELHKPEEKVEVLIGSEWKEATYISCIADANIFFCRLKGSGQIVSIDNEGIRSLNRPGRNDPNITFKGGTL